MSGKRKDHKGRILRTGESQRKDLSYQYRYTDPLGKSQTVYAATLDALCKKEDEIHTAQHAGLNYADGGITVVKLQKDSRGYSTITSVRGVSNLLSGWSTRKISCARTPSTSNSTMW